MIDLCVKDIYKKYLYNDPKPENMPTLQDFYERLNFYAPDKPAAQNIANSLQLYVTGSQNVFNHRSNVDTQNRVVCFDIRELGTNQPERGASADYSNAFRHFRLFLLDFRHEKRHADSFLNIPVTRVSLFPWSNRQNPCILGVSRHFPGSLH